MLVYNNMTTTQEALLQIYQKSKVNIKKMAIDLQSSNSNETNDSTKKEEMVITAQSSFENTPNINHLVMRVGNIKLDNVSENLEKPNSFPP